MSDLNRIRDLAIIGMAVVVSDGNGIDEFGRRVYRGLPITGQVPDKTTLKDLAIQSAQRVYQESVLSRKQVAVISLSPALPDALQAFELGNQVLDVSAEPNPLTAALISAANRLEIGEADAILLVEAQPAPSTGCALLLTLRSFALDNAKPLVAVVIGAAETQGTVTGSEAARVCHEALAAAEIQPELVGLIETASLTDSTIHPAEAQGLAAVYKANGDLTCALSAGEGGLLGLIKTAWRLKQRVITGMPQWAGLEQSAQWQQSPFYVPTESRTWFLPAGHNRRYAAFNTLSDAGGFAQFILRDEASIATHPNGALRHETLELFPIVGETVSQLIEVMTNLQSRAAAGANLAAEAQRAYAQYMVEQPSPNHTACLLSRTPEELQREIGFAVKGIPAAFDKKSDWQTPLGSYFTSQPLGGNGDVAFVYPGAFNSYPGVGRDLFYLFPNLYDRLTTVSSQVGELLNEKLLYPRSLTPLSQSDLETYEKQLNADPLAMLISGSSLAVIYTHLLRETFDIHPAHAFGYSLGEISMMFATSVWTNGDEISAALRASPLFRTRLAGSQDAIREYWNLPANHQSDSQEPLWGNFVLMAAADRVREVLVGEPRVFLTQINTPRQVVIAGDPAACRQVIEKLKCTSLQAPFNYALHCPPIHTEYSALTQLLSWQIAAQPGMTLYSESTCQPMPISQPEIANQIAAGLCNCLDFPRLIQQAYADGARIFVELGAGSNCARWVDETLNAQPHAAFSINRKGVDDHASILRLLARLACHRVPVNLNPLYS